MSETRRADAIASMNEAAAKLANIRAEHYPLMVSSIVGWLHAFDYHPLEIARALEDAVTEYTDWLRKKQLREDSTHAD